MKTEYRHARPEEVESIFSLYRTLAKTGVCTWDRDYPGWRDLMGDYAADSLYVALDGGTLVGVASLGSVDGLEALDCWEGSNGSDLARIGIDPQRQGKGEAKDFLRFLKRQARERGFDGIRLIVDPNNAPALKLYKGGGFRFKGEADLYDYHWHCYEWLVE